MKKTLVSALLIALTASTFVFAGEYSGGESGGGGASGAIEIQPTVYQSWGWEIPVNDVDAVVQIVQETQAALLSNDYAAFRRHIIDFGYRGFGFFALGRRSFPILEGQWALNRETMTMLHDEFVKRPSLQIFKGQVFMQALDFDGRLAKGETQHYKRTYSVRLSVNRDYAGDFYVDCDTFSGVPLDADDHNGRHWFCRIRGIYLVPLNH